MGPPVQILPWSLLLNNPAEVAANQRWAPSSTSLTRASSTDRTPVVLARDLLFPFFSLIARADAFSITMLLIGCQAVPPRASSNTPRLVPTIRVPLLDCLRVNTSRPSSPELFCSQFWPPS